MQREKEEHQPLVFCTQVNERPWALHISWVTNSYRRKSSCICSFICITSVAEAHANSVNLRASVLVQNPSLFSTPSVLCKWPLNTMLCYLKLNYWWEHVNQLSKAPHVDMVENVPPEPLIWANWQDLVLCLSSVLEQEISPNWSKWRIFTFLTSEMTLISVDIYKSSRGVLTC